MKRLLLIMSALLLCGIATAHTINWHVDGNIYQTTTCDSGESITPPTAPAKYGYHFVKWAEYLPIEYLESTGTQWIDTGIRPRDYYHNMIFEATFKPSDTLCGEHLASMEVGGIFYPLLVRGGYFMTNICCGGGEKKLAIQDRNKHTILLNLGNGNIVFDNSTFVENNVAGNNTMNIIIFGKNGSTVLTSCFKLYNLSLKKLDNTPIRDFIPVLDSNNVPCLYDKVSKQFFYNQGTGQFIAGPVVSE